MAVCFPLGWVAWDLAEYGIHRWWFHWEGNGPFTRKLHDIIHGYHHKYPDDSLRLVMPLGASIPLALLIAGGLYLVGAPAVTIPGFAGFVSRLPLLRLHPLVDARPLARGPRGARRSAATTWRTTSPTRRGTSASATGGSTRWWARSVAATSGTPSPTRARWRESFRQLQDVRSRLRSVGRA